MTAVDVVQRQVNAHHDRDLNNFVAEYSDAIVVHRMPATEPAIVGKVNRWPASKSGSPTGTPSIVHPPAVASRRS